MKKILIALSLTLSLALSGCMMLGRKGKDTNNSTSATSAGAATTTESMTQSSQETEEQTSATVPTETTVPPTTTTTTSLAPTESQEAEPSGSLQNGQVIESEDKDPAKRRIYLDPTQLEISEIEFNEDMSQDEQKFYAKKMAEGYSYATSWLVNYFNGDMQESNYTWVPEVLEAENIDPKEMHESFADLFLKLKSAGLLPVLDQNDVELTKMEESDDFNLVRVTYPWVDENDSRTYNMVIVVDFESRLSGFGTAPYEAQ